MQRSIRSLSLWLRLSLFALAAPLAAVGLASPAQASPSAPHAVQGRSRKKHHRPKSHHHAKARSSSTKTSSKDSKSPKNDRGFEL